MPSALPAAYRPAQIVTMYAISSLITFCAIRGVTPCPSRGRAHNLSSLLPRCSCSRAATPTPRPPPRPSVRSGYSASRSRTEDSARDFVGVVRARYENDLGFRVAGKIVTRVVNVGDRVHAGDVVARLDPQDLKLQVESAEAELAAATSNLAQAAAISSVTTTFGARLCVGRGFRAQEGGQRRGRRAARARPAAPSILRAINTAMPTSGRMPTASSPRRWPSPARSWPSARPWRGSPITARRKPWSRLPETWLADARKAERGRALWADRDRAFDAQLRELSPQADPATRTYRARFTIDERRRRRRVRHDRDRDAHARPGQRSGASCRSPPFSTPARDHRSTSSTPTGALALRPVTVASFDEDAALVTVGRR